MIKSRKALTFTIGRLSQLKNPLENDPWKEKCPAGSSRRPSEGVFPGIPLQIDLIDHAEI